MHRLKGPYLWLLAIPLLIGLGSSQQSSAQETLPKEVMRFADVILFNGKVLTADQDFTIAEALAIRDGKVMAAGSSASIARMADQNTRRIDLEGKTVIPGVIANHEQLSRYAPDRWRDELEDLEPNLRDLRPRPIQAESAEDFLAKLEHLMASIEPGRWTRVDVRPVNVAREVWDNLSIEDIDRVSPNNPLMVWTARTSVFFNSQIRQAVQRTYGYDVSQWVGRDGSYLGRGGVARFDFMMADLIIQEPMKSLAHAYRKETEVWASKGVTTWSSDLPGLVTLNVYSQLDRNGEMPMRFGYSHAMGDNGWPHSIGFYERLGDVAGHGTPHLWSIGVSAGPVLRCNSPELAMHFREQVICNYAPGTVPRANLLAKVTAGLRIAAKDVHGDAAPDQFMDIIEAGSRAAGMSLEDIRAKRHVMSLCSFHPNEAQVGRARRLGIIFSCRPAMLRQDANSVEPSGYEYVDRLTAPIKRILDGGGKVALEFDNTEAIGSREGNIFKELLILVNRTDSQGQVWGADQAIDRRTVLLIATRWSAEYVLREDVLGSLEPGKWADLLILDKDYLAASEEDFANIQVLLTLVGGKIVYSEPAFAAAKGLPNAGFR